MCPIKTLVEEFKEALDCSETVRNVFDPLSAGDSHHPSQVGNELLLPSAPVVLPGPTDHYLEPTLTSVMDYPAGALSWTCLFVLWVLLSAEIPSVLSLFCTYGSKCWNVRWLAAFLSRARL